MRTSATILLAALFAAAAAAHPMPNDRYDRALHVRVGPGGVVVKYTLQLTETTAARDSKGMFDPAEEARLATRKKEFVKAYSARKAVLLADGLHATLGGKPVEFRVEKTNPEPDVDHLKFGFVFRADWTPPPGRHAFTFEDANFENRTGVVTLTIDRTAEGEVEDVVEPFDLRGRSPLDWQPGDEQRARRGSAVLVVPGGEPAPAPPTPVPEPAPAPTPVARNWDVAGLAALSGLLFGFARRPTGDPTPARRRVLASLPAFVVSAVADAGRLDAYSSSALGTAAAGLFAGLVGAAAAFRFAAGRHARTPLFVPLAWTLLGLPFVPNGSAVLIPAAFVVASALGGAVPAAGRKCRLLPLVAALLLAGTGLYHGRDAVARMTPPPAATR